MNEKLFKDLEAKGFITAVELEQVLQHKHKPVSLHWDLKIFLYVGILLLTSGLGITIYKNIDTIGHIAIVLFIAVATVSCFAYCFAKGQGYSSLKVSSPGILFDYLLLLGCLLLLILVGYLQFQHEIFGQRWGLATFFPMVILFFSAYYFDHLGVLSLAIVNLAAWLGISITPLTLLKANDFNDNNLIYTGILLGLLLISLSFFSSRTQLKKHFSFTYKNFGIHIFFISTLAAIFSFQNYYWLYFILLLCFAVYQFLQALKEHSFYFLVSVTIYFYIAVSYIIVDGISSISSFGEGQLYAILLYFIASSVGLAFFLIHFNKIIKRNDSI